MATPSRTRTARRERERELVVATRTLFDARGMQDAPIEEIARAVGINKALIYRSFESKAELFALTLEDYLLELNQAIDAVGTEGTPVETVRALSETFIDYGLAHPAFLDCALSLMRQPAGHLGEVIREGVMYRLGRAIASCLQPLVHALAEGSESKHFTSTKDPWFTANLLYAQVLGAMQIARVGIGVHYVAPGVPGVFGIDQDAVRQTCIAVALSVVTDDPS